MATKLDYLRDLKDHPNSTGGEAAARLDVSEATVLEAFRRARRQGFVEGDGKRPEKFHLLEAGLAELRMLEQASNPNPNPNPAAGLEQKFDELEQTVRDTVEDVKGLFGLVDRILQGKRQASADSLTDELHAEVEELEAEKERLGQERTKSARAIELHGVETVVAVDQYGDGEFEARAEKLAGELGPETAEEVRRLVGLEQELREERSRWFGPNQERVRVLEAEIAQLRGQLGFPVQSSEKEQEDESEEAE